MRYIKISHLLTETKLGPLYQDCKCSGNLTDQNPCYIVFQSPGNLFGFFEVKLKVYWWGNQVRLCDLVTFDSSIQLTLEFSRIEYFWNIDIDRCESDLKWRKWTSFWFWILISHRRRNKMNLILMDQLRGLSVIIPDYSN